MIYKEPITIKNLTFKNRFIMAPVKTAYGTPNGDVTERHLVYYNNISKNDVAMIILEPVSVSQSGKEHPKQLTIHQENSVENLRKIVEVLHKNNTLACISLNHAGRAANPKATGMPPKAPSAITCPSTGQTPDELTVEEIEGILKDYEKAVKNAVEAGFNAIEIQCGHGYLIHQFLSDRLNKRDDEYGKDKTLFLKRVLEIVSQTAPEIVKFVRISANEFVENGLEPEDNKIILDLAKEYGFDAVHCGLGNACDSPPWYYSHMALPEDKQIDSLKKIRKITDLPIIAAGRMADIDKIKLFEKENIADFIAFGRPLVADHELVRKIVNDNLDDIVYCGYCLQGCLFNVKNGKGLGCIVNPEIDRPKLIKTDNPKKVAVIGGGPAGMSAAITLSRMGHNVTLFEKENELGGQFRLAPLAPHKESMTRPLKGLINKTLKYVKDIKLNYTFTEKDIDSFEYYIVATGSRQNIPEIENLDSQYWITSLEFFEKTKEVKGKRVLIIGAGMVGMEAAEYLVDKGYEVVITKRTDTIANDMEPITKNLMLKRLANKDNIKIMPNTRVIAFEKDKVIYETNGEKGEWESFDTVIVASGMLPNHELHTLLVKKRKNVLVVGDANCPEDIFAATQQGYKAAISIV
ncbi:NADH:flavin oxidoreductase/NADH oxidase [Deferribacter desulfuricans SSM1]|uniref:NADH:flavin oxidoreductase/NADH oxidase n=1 Tax=Deferribacter desulfuricans (strain DSM 14783 / JCM 11476 / NBRC 101012 / SSM1) TaxID=639282 RepID=D3P8W0_DEFDS|nr:NAD(P)/FAD-dependent oxidoreductase [Deferribacter desulfuricans]BAI81150.1 NADH:flavin oxidoreductase/NADH oxidase [Deferribacter desulfuricans SSM1]